MPGMANPENIEPHKIRSTSEAREKGRAGGLRSGARRRELASLKEAARLILSMDSASPKHNKAMELMGLDPDERTNAAAVTATMVMRAAEGDVKAYEALSKNMALLDSDRQAEREDADPAARQAPPFDLSAAIAPTFCAVSRAVEAGIQEVVLKGGRGSAKSSYAYQKQLDVFLSRPDSMWLCMRRYANTLRRSCFANVLWAIRKRGMTIGRSGEDADFTASVSPMEVVYNATGQKILFSGLDDPEKLKSITFDDPRKKIEILTWEEYSQFDPADVRNVEYSVLRADYGLEFKLFNPPPDSEHWANREAADKADDPAVLVHHSTWRDVPEEFLGARFVANAERMYRESPEAARNELDGECIELQGRVFRNVEERTVTDEEIAEFRWIRRGLDWGYETDPWVLLDVAYDRKRRELVIYGEEWRHHMLNADTAAVVKEHLAERGSDGRPIRDEDGEPVFRRDLPANEVRCDIAERKSIADYRAYGINAVGASKRVPVADGIVWLKGRAHRDRPPPRAPRLPGVRPLPRPPRQGGPFRRLPGQGQPCYRRRALRGVRPHSRPRHTVRRQAMAKIATEGGGWRGAAERWLQGLGYPAACIETPMSGFVDEWWRYYRSEADFYVSELRDVNGTPHTVKVRSCTPARMVCEDMAGLIYNERASVSVAEDGQAGQAAEWLAGWLARTRFDDGAPQLVQRMCATGTGAWALHLRGVQVVGKSPGLGVSPQRYDARHIAPLDWDGEECTACAFVSQVAVRGELLTQVEVHRPNDRGDYEIMTRFFRDDGETVVPDGYSGGAISTRQPRKTFELVTLALDNPYWEGSPFGVALFDAALGAIETTELAFDNIGNELVLGRKMVMIPEAMLRRDEATGRMMLPQEERLQFYVALKDATVYADGRSMITEYNPSLRADEDVRMLSTALQVLGKRCGFGTKYYALDESGGVATAKQVASDNAEMMRTVHKHEQIVRPAIEGIVTAAASVFRSLGGLAIPDIEGAVNVVMGDSIIQDDDSLRERDRADVAAGLLAPWRYMVRWQGYSEDEAREECGLADASSALPVEA